MIISFQNIKYANNEWHKNVTNIKIGIFLKTEVCEGGSSFIRVNAVFLYIYSKAAQGHKNTNIPW
jgi:hypothetical protein